MFDFRFELRWEAPDLEEGPAKGALVYPDVGQDCDGIYDVECRVSVESLKSLELAFLTVMPPCFLLPREEFTFLLLISHPWL